MDVARGKFDRRLHRLVGVADLVELLEIGLQSLQDFDGVVDGRLVDVDLLEAAHERAILFEILAIFLVGRRADAAQHALRERRLEQIGGIHRAARRRAGADDGVDFVDEQNRVLVLLDLLHHLLEALLEVAAIARAGEQRAHVEREHRRVGEHLGHRAIDDLTGEAFGDRRLADAGFADQQRIVLLPAAQDLDGALHFGLAADQRIDPAILRLLVEVDAVGIERAFLFLLLRPSPSNPSIRALRGPLQRRAASSRRPTGRAVWRCRG